MAEPVKTLNKGPEPQKTNPPELKVGVQAARSYVEETEQILKEAGWEQVSKNEVTGLSLWADPCGVNSKPRPVTRVELPNLPPKEGPPTVIFQTTGDPIPWDYTTEQAMAIQKQRDAFGDNPSPLSRLQALQKEYDTQRDALQRIVEQVTKVATGPIPTKPEEFNLFRRKLTSSLDEAKKALPQAKVA
jgi:hypothetical protein